MSDYKVFNDNVEERTWEELYQDNVMLQQENQKQKEVIDKAIGYIEENTCWELRTSKLLDILKGVSE